MLVVVVDGDHDRLRVGLALAQRRDHVDAGAVGQAEVDQRELKLHHADQAERVVHAGGFGNQCAREHLHHERLHPGANFWQVFEQEDVVHAKAQRRQGRRVRPS